MRKFFKSALVIINIVFAFLLLICYISSYFNPIDLSFFSYLVIIFPIIVFINILYIIFWAVFLKLYFLISLISIIIGYSIINKYIQIPLSKEKKQKVFTIPQNDSNKIKIMSYNVHLFDLNNSTLPDPNHNIISFIKSEKPDILCIQEFYSTKYKNYELLFKKECPELKYSFFHTLNHKKNKNKKYGIAIYSRYKIINKETIPFENTSNMSIFVDILFNNDTIRIFNNHLQSLRLQKNNYNFLRNFGQNNQEVEEEFKDISLRYKTAAKIRTQQVEKVTELISKTKHPIIVCGDFNDTPLSYTYRRMKNNLSDAFTEAGFGLGNSYHVNIPLFRIDYIFYSSHFTAYHFRTPKIILSDHRPVICFLLKNS
jgi:endonuclease/exonuclease/phosphatase (EEP) superfamily protein YafD